jgi:hypothetical protein
MGEPLTIWCVAERGWELRPYSPMTFHNQMKNRYVQNTPFSQREGPKYMVMCLTSAEADELPRGLAASAASPALRQVCPSLFSPRLFLLFLCILISRQLFAHGSPGFLNTLALVG